MKESAKISNPAFSVDLIVARMKEAAARTGPLSDGASTEVVTSAEFQPTRRRQATLSEFEIETLRLQPPFHPSSDGRYHVNDLLKYHDRNFIQNAYRAILKRSPDATGYRGFIESLRSGRLNKIDILARLRHSAEGRAKQVEIDGLELPALVRRAYRVPFIGYFLNLAIALSRLPMTSRSAQQFEAHVLAQQEMVVTHLNHVSHTLRTHAAEVALVVHSQSESIKELSSHTQQRMDDARRRLELLAQVQSEFERSLTDRLALQGEAIDARFNELRGVLEAQRSELQRQFEQQYTLLEQQYTLLGSQLRELEAQIPELEQRFATRLVHETAQRESERKATLQHLEEMTSQAQEKFAAVESRLREWQELLRLSETQLHQADLSQREQLEVATRTFKREVERVFQKQQEVSTELVLQGNRLGVVLAEARKRLPGPLDVTQLRTLAAEEGHTLDAFYASFDEQFRGSREEIKQRLKVYLPIIRQRGIGDEAMPLLDVGCGRGEWLELLKEERLQASGVDSNRILVDWCRDCGLEVSEEDLMTYLRRQPDASLGALTGFHIIEHLAIETLVEFLNQAVRVVRPGGVVIFETPNPQNVLVGSCNFYFDPTHRNPLPSQVTSFLLESRGFVGVEVLNLNPSDDSPVPETSELARRFNHYFYGPMDYAVVGYRT